MGTLKHASRLACLIGCLALLPGCLMGLIANDRRARAATLAQMDSGCPATELVEQLGDQRYKFRGCGSAYVYACVDQPRYYGHKEV